MNHSVLRAFLQRLGSNYIYREAVIDDRDYQPVVISPRVALPGAPFAASPPAGGTGPDALAFAFAGAPRPAPPANPAPAAAEPALRGPRPEPAFQAQPLRPVLSALEAVTSLAAVEQREYRHEQHQSLAEFLNIPQPEYRPDWVAQEPPDLTGIDSIILNFETNGLNWRQGHRPIGVTIGTLDGQLKRYLPFAHKEGGNLDEAAVIRYLQREVRGKHIINANTRFDVHMARQLQVDLEEQGNTVSDIQHTAALLDDHRLRFGIDYLAADYLGGVQVPRVDESRMADYHAAEVAPRAEYQAQIVAELRNVMYPLIDEQDLRRVHDLEDAVIYPVCEMEKNGAPIDMELLETYSARCKEMHDTALWEVAKEVGFAFDHTPSSWRRLFDHFALPVAHLKSQKETFADGIIAKIDHPVIKQARFAGQLASLNSKIFKPYKEMVTDGILHFELNQLRSDEGGTVSGRFSAGFIQQVPNRGNHFATFGDDLFPRRLYVAGVDALSYLAADAAQIQYRIFAHHANNPRVLEAYARDPKTHFHKMIMEMLLPYKPDLPYEGLKSLNFMKIFGGGLLKIAIMMGFVTDAEADEIRERKTQRSDPRLAFAREIEEIYARELPEVGPLLRQASHLAMPSCDKFCHTTVESRRLHTQLPHRGYVRTVLGRRSRFPNSYRLYKAFCMVDQGSEGDIMKTKIVELHRERKHTGFLMRQTVHDEVSGDALAPDTMMKVDEILNRQSFPQLKVPIIFETKVGATWADAK